MKRLLVLNQYPDSTLEYPAINQMNLQIEEVNSISEVFKRQLFRIRPAGDLGTYVGFMINVNQPNSEIVEFLLYIRKIKPELPLIILCESIEKTLVLKALLRGITYCFSESDQLEYVFNQIIPSLSASWRSCPLFINDEPTV